MLRELTFLAMIQAAVVAYIAEVRDSPGSEHQLCFPFVPQRDEVGLHKKLRTEVIQLEDTLAQVRKEYEMLRIEFEQTLAANEQAGTMLLCCA